MKFLSVDEPWTDISTALKSTRSKVFCAIGYVGVDAPEILILGSGDVLVCDASDATVKSGSTYPEALLAYAKAGVTIHSVSGLHAKVIVSGDTAWVGSMNASTSSTKLIEASIRLENKKIIQETMQFILVQKSLSVPLSQVDIRRLIALPRRKKPRKTGVSVIKSLEFPKEEKSLRLLVTEDDKPLNNHQKKYIRQTRREIKEQSDDALKGNSALVFIREPGDTIYRRGDWLLEVRGRWVKCPAVIADITGSGRSRYVWLYRPSQNIQSISLKQINQILKNELPKNDDVRISAARAKEIWAAFR